MLKKIAAGIAGTFGSNCEVLIHNFSCPEHAIVDIHNGHVTGRKVGDPLSNQAIKDMTKGEQITNLVNYEAKTEDGRRLKSTNIICKGKNYNYALCINYDCTNLEIARSIIEDITKTGSQHEENYYNYSWEKVYDEMFEKAVGLVGKPIPLMNKEDRMDVVKYLSENGAFVFQNGVVICAERMNVSRFTIYNYLKELSNKNKEKEKLR